MCRYSSNVTHVWRTARGWEGVGARVCGVGGAGGGATGARRPHASRRRHSRDTAAPSARPQPHSVHSALVSLPRHTSARPRHLPARARANTIQLTHSSRAVRNFSVTKCFIELEQIIICELWRKSEMRSRSSGKEILWERVGARGDKRAEGGATPRTRPLADSDGHAARAASAMDDKPTAVGGEEHYSLRWNNHQAHLLRSFEALLHAETLVDVTLVCAERRVRAHKVLLGACSPLFRRIFSENPCKHPVIVLKDFQGWEVQAVVDFMYRGEVSVAQEQLGTVIRAGESLQVRGLADQDREEQARSPPPTPLARSPVQTTPPAPSPPASPASPQPRRKQARPRRRSGESDTPENLSMRRSPSCGLKAVRLARPRSPPKQEPEEPEPETHPPPRMFQPHQDMFPPVPPAVSALSLTPPHSKYIPP